MSRKIVHIGRASDALRHKVRDVPGAFELVECAHDDHSELETADAVVGWVSESALAAASRLVWVHSWQAGPDSQLFPEFVEHPAVFTCSKGNGAIPLAEHAMMMMLMLNRNALRWLDAQRERKWDRFTHNEINGLTVGIIGVGNSGSDLAQKAKAFHMRVLGLARSARSLAGFDRVYGPEGLHDLLAAVDFLVVTAPLTPETENLLGEAEFRAMKPGAYYICFSRGGIADDDALFAALDQGRIAGAALDAHTEEPLAPDNRFWTAPNTIITPHNGATTEQTAERGQDIFVENLRRFMTGEPLLNVVDKTLGY